MEENKVIFADGINFYKPKEGAPTFIKGKVSINPKKLIEFMHNNAHNLSEKGYLFLDLKVSKNTGELYLQLNTWKPTTARTEEIKKDVAEMLSDVPRHSQPFVSNLSDEEKVRLAHARDSHNEANRVYGEIEPERIAF